MNNKPNETGISMNTIIGGIELGQNLLSSALPPVANQVINGIDNFFDPTRGN